jgi:predicted outer membrane repeat protein
MNLTFSGNRVASRGGGIYNDNSSVPTLTAVVISNNEAQVGGGISNYTSSNPSLTNVTFSGNQAVAGGGMYNFNSSPTLATAIFDANQTQSSGSGMYNYSSSPMLAGVTFSGNQTSGGTGGGMYNRTSSSPSLTDVTFSGNQAQSGGGIFNDSASNPTLTNVVFKGNQASNYYGGGIANFSSSPTLMNVTFSGNYADAAGGGMYNESSGPILTNVTFTGNASDTSYGGGIYNFASSPTLTNGVIWNNLAGISGDQIYNDGGSFTISYSDIQGSGGSGAGWDTAMGTDGGNNIDDNPLFVTLVNPTTAPTTAGDLHLQVGSPAVNAGDNGVCPATDLDGIPRPQNALCDMGAYEQIGTEIDVRGNGISIADGDMTPSTADHTDFGSTAVGGFSAITRTFTILNTGLADLNLTDSPRVSIGGLHAADFALATDASTPITAGGQTTFQVAFDPSACGLRQATISIANNDADENPYNFSIQGIGIASSFPDVPSSHWAWQFVETIFCSGLTAGYPDGTYRPDNQVIRAEMAVFLKKGIHGASYLPPTADGSHPFSDISGHWAEAWIEDLFDEGFTSGFPDGTFRPLNNVTCPERWILHRCSRSLG